jgi:NADH:ubiquinone oxidoreductase subunit 6 (subunit J)
MIAAWVFAGITLAAVFCASFVSQMRQAILALWVAGLGVGAIYLAVGAEFLAVIQWMVSTLVAISFIFFSVMFGEYGGSPYPIKRQQGVLIFLSLVLGALFAGVIAWGARSALEGAHDPQESFRAAGDLAVFGQKLIQDHLLSLEVLALTLFFVLVGGGVIARSEHKGETQ